VWLHKFRRGSTSTPRVRPTTVLTMSQPQSQCVPMIASKTIQYERRGSRRSGSGVSASDHPRCVQPFAYESQLTGRYRHRELQ
jgi:hypothetical protein